MLKRRIVLAIRVWPMNGNESCLSDEPLGGAERWLNENGLQCRVYDNGLSYLSLMDSTSTNKKAANCSLSKDFSGCV